MDDTYPSVKLAAVQAAPVWLDREATTLKACRLIEEAADYGAKLIGFPEGFIPGFPDWFNWFMPRSPEAIRFQKALFKNAIEVRGQAIAAIAASARRGRCHVVMGVNERDDGSLGSLFNSQVFIDNEGEILGVHRKLVPTLTERLVHTSGDGHSIRTYCTSFGPIGGLICGENTNSLARFALLAKGERFHVASWPAFPFTKRNHFETIDIRAQYHALEGRVFVISACGILDDACLDAMGLDAEQRATLGCRGGNSGIIGPSGSYIVGPIGDQEEILYADANIESIIEGKFSYDTIGHSNRFDIFKLTLTPADQTPFP